MEPSIEQSATIERMFDQRSGDDGFGGWDNLPGYPTLRPVDRAVTVDGHQAFPSVGLRRLTGVSMATRAYGLRVDPMMDGQLRVWLAVFDGTWLGGVDVVMHSGNRRSELPMRLWLPPSALTPKS